MIVAFHDYVVVEREKSSDRVSNGGINLVDSRQPDIAVVKDIGFGAERLQHDMGIDVGSRVIVSQLAGTEVYVNGETVTLVRIEDIIGKIEEDAVQE